MASKSEWNEFFLDAKIPKDIAARYAVNFYKNRMSFDMLADLNKVKFHIFFVFPYMEYPLHYLVQIGIHVLQNHFFVCFLSYM